MLNQPCPLHPGDSTGTSAGRNLCQTRRAAQNVMNLARQRAVHVLLCSVLGLTLSCLASADTFRDVHYEARTDELVARMIYRGTNPNHNFTLQWDVCHGAHDSGQPYEIAAEVMDDQWDNAALEPFDKTVRFSLSNLTCRPAKVTLRTAPRFFYTVYVPPAPAKP